MENRRLPALIALAGTSIGGVIEAELEDVAEPIAEISVVPD